MTTSVANSAAAAGSTSVPAGITCGTLGVLDELTTNDYIYPITCPADTIGRYIHLAKAPSTGSFGVAEVETYINSAGMK